MHLSIWEKESFFAPADVIIAGGGLTGLWSAFYLKKRNPGLRITIAERGIIPSGASTRNAGFACFGSPTELLHDVATLGEDQTLSLFEMRYRGIQKTRKLLGRKAIGFEKCGGYELFIGQTEAQSRETAERIQWLNKLIQPVTGSVKTFVRADKQIKKLGLSGVSHLVYNPYEGSLHSGKLCEVLLHLVRSLDVNILPGLEITGYEETASGIKAYTASGVVLSGAQLLICTNAFARQLLPSLEVHPARGQVLVTSPISKLRLNGTFHYQEGFYYFRNLGTRVLLGGARNIAIEKENTEEPGVSDLIQDHLESFLSTHILSGKKYEITDRWSGIMGMGPEKLPIVRKISAGVFCAVRMSGMGVALAPVAGEQVSAMMLGR